MATLGFRDDVQDWTFDKRLVGFYIHGFHAPVDLVSWEMGVPSWFPTTLLAAVLFFCLAENTIQVQSQDGISPGV